MRLSLTRKNPKKTAETAVEKPGDTVEKSDDKLKRHTWTDEDTQTLIHFYNKGTKYVVLADMFGVPKERLQQKIYDLKKSEQWGRYFNGYKEETTAEPETLTAALEEVREVSPIGTHMRDLKAYFADFVIEECKREIIPDAVEIIGAYLKYLEEKVNVNE